MNFAVTWIANGFSPESPFTTDEFSHTALDAAVKEYNELKRGGQAHVPFLSINSIVRDPKGMAVLRDTVLADIRRAGIPEEDIVLLPMETTGSTTDGYSIALYAKGHPDVLVEVFATTPVVARYFKTMYTAVAYYLIPGTDAYQDGYRLPLLVRSTVPSGRAKVKSYIIYAAMRFVTRLAARSRWSFMRWYNFLNRAYEGRREGFERTVT